MWTEFVGSPYVLFAPLLADYNIVVLLRLMRLGIVKNFSR